MYDCHDIKSVYSAKIYAGSEAHLTFQSRYSLFPLFLSFFCYYSFSCTDVFRSSVVLWRTLPIRSFPNQNYYSSSAVLNNGVRVLVRDCSISLNDRVNAPRWRILSTLNLSALCIGIKLNLNALCIGIKLISIHNIKLRSQDHLHYRFLYTEFLGLKCYAIWLAPRSRDILGSDKIDKIVSLLL